MIPMVRDRVKGGEPRFSGWWRMEPEFICPGFWWNMLVRSGWRMDVPGMFGLWDRGVNRGRRG